MTSRLTTILLFAFIHVSSISAQEYREQVLTYQSSIVFVQNDDIITSHREPIRKKKWAGKKSYFGTLTDLRNYVTKKTGWNDLDLETTKKMAIWSSVGLVGVLILVWALFIWLPVVPRENYLTSKNYLMTDKELNKLMLNYREKQEKRHRRKVNSFFVISAILTISALIIQNIASIKYLVTAGEIDFLRFGITPFWPFVWRFLGVAAVITIVLFYNIGINFIGSVRAIGEVEHGLFGLILPIISYLLMMLASLLNFIHINILPFSFKVLLIGCVAELLIFPIITMVKKGKVWISLICATVSSFSMGSLGVIISYFLPTLALLSIVAIVGGGVLAFMISGGGLASAGSIQQSPEESHKEEEESIYMGQILSPTHKQTYSGEDVYNGSFNTFFIKTSTGDWKEISEDQIDK